MGLNSFISSARWWVWSAFILLLGTKRAWAESGMPNLDTEIDPVATPMPSMLSLLVKLIVSLLLVGGLAYLTIRFLKRNTQVTSRSDSISILDQFAMGMNKGLFIVEIAGKVMVLGVTDQNINILFEITDSNLVEELRSKAADRENEPLIPPRFWEVILSKSNSFKKPETNFSSHIQDQIKKLQATAGKSTAQPTGKDERYEQDGR